MAGAALAGASVVGVASMAHAAEPEEGSASDAVEVAADQKATVGFQLKSWSDRDWVVSNVFAVDGSGNNGRVGPFLPEDSYPAVGTVMRFGDSLTVKVDGSSWGTHGVSVVFYNRANPKEKIQLWFHRGFFSSWVDATFPDHMLVQSSGGNVNVWDLDW